MAAELMDSLASPGAFGDAFPRQPETPTSSAGRLSPDGTAPCCAHSSISFELKYRNSGYTITVTRMNRMTFPAVAKPKKPAWYSL